MKHYSLEDLSSLISQACVSSDSWLIPENSLFTEVLWNQMYSTTPQETLRCDQLFTKLTAYYKMDADQISSTIHSIAFDAYSRKDVIFAEFCFRLARRYKNDISYSNNLAYTLRRHHEMDMDTQAEIISLLLPGIIENEEFSIVNMALFFAINLGTSNDWITADKLIQQLEQEPSGVERWWSDLATQSDAEGYLVILWLLRHKKIFYLDSIGTHDEIIAKVKAAYFNAPSWLFNMDMVPEPPTNND